MRLFVALDIDEAIRERIARFVQGVRGFAPEARWVNSESLHVTLKFIGEQPPESMSAIQGALSALHCETVALDFRGCGFFPNPKSARIFWVGIQDGDALPSLAESVDRALEAVGIPGENHAYTPHLTLARGAGGGSGAPRWRNDDRENSRFAKLQQKLPSLTAEFGTMTAREFFLYQSQLSPKGSRYSKIAQFGLS
jgi:RNA 2',3'-cyclic 3'-phosphodiesterase